MKPAPPVTMQSIESGSLETGRDESPLPKGGGPAPRMRYGPDRRTTLVGLGAVRRPARKGAMLAGPCDLRVDA